MEDAFVPTERDPYARPKYVAPDPKAKQSEADVIIEEASNAGMNWTLCYEDRYVQPDPASAERWWRMRVDWEYIRDEYIARRPGVLRDQRTRQPIFYNFGPVAIKETHVWTNMLSTVFPIAADRPKLQGTDLLNADTILPDAR